jgi:TolB protein
MRRYYQILSLAVIVIVPAGCQQFYNGWPESADMGPDPASSGPSPAMQSAQAKAPSGGGQQAAVQPAANTPQPGPNRMHTFGPMGQARPGEQAPAPGAEADGRHQTRPLQLWGQLADGKPHQWEGLDAARNVRQVTTAGEGADFDPTFAPNDGSLVFASTRHRQTADLYRKQPGGHAITQLTSDPANDLMPAVSPDGSQIAFASDRSGNWDIYLMNASGQGNVVRVTDNPAHDLHPSFSPDGQRLVYCSYSQRAGQWQLVVRRLGSPGSRQILGEGLFPTWAPDSSRILYQRARQRGTRWFSVWSIRFEDGRAGAPTELAASQEAALITPAWGPKGERIVFCTVTQPTADDQARPRRADLWMMHADGGHRTRLTGGRFGNLQPTWASDGTIFFVSDRGEPSRDGLWSLEPVEGPTPGATPTAADKPSDDTNKGAANAEDAKQGEQTAQAAANN